MGNKLALLGPIVWFKKENSCKYIHLKFIIIDTDVLLLWSQRHFDERVKEPGIKT